MLNIIKQYETLIATFVLTFLLTIIIGLVINLNSLKNKVETLTNDLNKINSLLVVEKANNTTLKASIDSQNIEIEKVSINLDEKMKELEEWKNKPPNIKYKTIEKIIKQGDSNECENIKNMLDDIRNTSF